MHGARNHNNVHQILPSFSPLVPVTLSVEPSQTPKWRREHPHVIPSRGNFDLSVHVDDQARGKKGVPNSTYLFRTRHKQKDTHTHIHPHPPSTHPSNPAPHIHTHSHIPTHWMNMDRKRRKRKKKKTRVPSKHVVKCVNFPHSWGSDATQPNLSLGGRDPPLSVRGPIALQER